jgi:Protein of unknown function (DUF3180)
MTPTRIRTLIVAGLAGAIAVWLLLRLAYAALPPLPWTGIPALLLLAIAETVCGRSVRARLRGRPLGGSRPLRIAPIAVARMAALAKASSLAAALIAGLAAGFLTYVAGSLDKTVYRQDAYAAGGTLACAVALTAAALYLEYGCRVPTSGDKPGQPSAPGLPD